MHCVLNSQCYITSFPTDLEDVTLYKKDRRRHTPTSPLTEVEDDVTDSQRPSRPSRSPPIGPSYIRDTDAGSDAGYSDRSRSRSPVVDIDVVHDDVDDKHNQGRDHTDEDIQTEKTLPVEKVKATD